MKGWAKMPVMKVEEFEIEITSPQRKPFYVVVGDDPSAVHRCLEAARKAVDPALYQLNYRQYGLEALKKSTSKRSAQESEVASGRDDLKTVAWVRMTQELTTNPFGKPPRIVLILLSENENPSAEVLEKLLNFRPLIVRSATLILMQRSAPDARLKFFKTVQKDGLLVDCQLPSRANLPNWLVAKFKEQGLRIGPDAVRAMIDRIGSNPGILLSEIGKLAVYPGPSVIITKEHIRTLVSLGSTSAIFELGSPLATGRLEKAVPILMDLLAANDAIPITSALGTHFRQLTHIKVIIEAKNGWVSDEELAAATGVNQYRLKLFREQLELWTLPRLREAMAAIVECQRTLVTSSMTRDLPLQALVVKLANLAKPTRNEVFPS
jgi:DNA polymerase-3 subunit delta